MKNNRGLTLIEVIITIAIIGIMVIPIFAIFDRGLNNIKKSGERTEEVFKIQDDVNEFIKNSNGDTHTIKVIIPKISIEKEVKGKKISIEENNIKIITFVPDDNNGED